MKEARIEINGTLITEAMSMTIRVAVENFVSFLEENGLGDDEHGLRMRQLYMERIEELRTLLLRKVRCPSCRRPMDPGRVLCNRCVSLQVLEKDEEAKQK